MNKPVYHASEPERSVVYAYADDIAGMKAEIERLEMDRKTYEAWATEIKVNIDAMKAEIEQFREAAKRIVDEVILFDTVYTAPPDERALMYASEGGGTFTGLHWGDLRRVHDAVQQSQIQETK